MSAKPELPANPTLEDVRRYVAEMRRHIADLQAEADAKQAGLLAIEGAGKPAVDSTLSRRHEYATIRGMPSTQIVAQTRKRRGPPSEGPVTDLAVELGFSSMKELADALKEKEANLRSWNHRGSIPGDRAAKIDRLRASRATKKRA